jgi:hypothetical protein
MGCETEVKPGGMCSAAHCSKYIKSSDAKAYCDCINWKDKPISGCTKKGANEPTWTDECYDNVEKRADPEVGYDECKQRILKDPARWDWRRCACCCSCYAWFTQILVDKDNVRFVQDMDVGDQVYVASIGSVNGGVQLTWETRTLDFSDGTAPNPRGQDMLRVVYRLPRGHTELIATYDQLFLMPDGKTKRADMLVPGENLVGSDGSLVAISGISVVGYTGGIHHVATPLDEAGPIRLDGHLLSSNGVVTGDYWTQVFHMTGEGAHLLVDGHEGLPVLGSDEYAGLPGVRATRFSATLEGEEVPPSSNPFVVAREELSAPAPVPRDARAYFTPGQARDVRRAPHAPPSSQRNVANFAYLRQLLGGFFPDVNLYLHWEDDDPNLYAFILYGQKTVYVSGRLLRTKAVEMEGLAAILGHGIALFLATDNLTTPDYACTGVADYYGLGYVLKDTFNFNWSPVATTGYEQLQALFAFVTGSHRDGDPNALCRWPSVDCRLESLNAALSGFNIPPCAQGPVPGGLQLESAVASLDVPASVEATFNQSVDFVTAGTVTNYQITPVAEVTTALRDDVARDKVTLTVRFPDPPEGEYALVVTDVRSQGGSTLDPRARTANFSVGGESL